MTLNCFWRWRFSSWSLKNAECPLIAITLKFILNGRGIIVRISYISQINLFKNYSYSKVVVGDHSRGWPEGSLFRQLPTPGCSGGRYSFPWIAPLYPWSVPYNAECYARRHQVPFFECLVWLDLGWNRGLPGQWRTQ